MSFVITIMPFPRKPSREIAVCGIVVQSITLLDHITERVLWVDKDQMDSFLQEYDRSSDKERFLRDKRAQHDTILNVHLFFPFLSSILLIVF